MIVVGPMFAIFAARILVDQGIMEALIDNWNRWRSE
jgi:hypothetical protein